MNVALVVLLALNLVVLLVLLMQTRRLRRRSADLAAQVEEARAAALQSVAAPAFVPPKGRLITIEILNPSELAATQSRFSGLAGAVAPNLLRKIVYEKAVDIMREQLRAQGVEAEVAIRVGT